MENQEIINTLSQYKSDFEGILSRFRHSRERIDIDRKDDPIYRQKVLEVIDFLNDHLGQNQYSRMISTHFNSGISNYFRTPSYKSVENIIGILGAAITRLDRGLGLLDRTKAKRAPFSWRKTTPKEKKNGKKLYQSRTFQFVVIPLIAAILGSFTLWFLNKISKDSGEGATISTAPEIGGDSSHATAASGPNKPAMIDYNSPGSKLGKEKPPPLMKRDETAIEPEIEKQESKSVYEAGEALLEIFKADSIETIPDLPIIRTYWKSDLACSQRICLLPERASEIGRGSYYAAKFSFYYEAKQSGKYGFTIVNMRRSSYTDFSFGVKGNAFKITIGGIDIVKVGREPMGQGVCNLTKGFHRVEFWFADKVGAPYPRGFQVKVLAPGAFDAVTITKDMMLLKKE